MVEPLYDVGGIWGDELEWNGEKDVYPDAGLKIKTQCVEIHEEIPLGIYVNDYEFKETMHKITAVMYRAWAEEEKIKVMW